MEAKRHYARPATNSRRCLLGFVRAIVMVPIMVPVTIGVVEVPGIGHRLDAGMDVLEHPVAHAHRGHRLREVRDELPLVVHASLPLHGLANDDSLASPQVNRHQKGGRHRRVAAGPERLRVRGEGARGKTRRSGCGFKPPLFGQHTPSERNLLRAEAPLACPPLVDPGSGLCV